MAISGRLALVGGGNMGSALLRGILDAGLAGPDQVVVAEKDQQRGRELAEGLKVSVSQSADGLGRVDTLILAVKPPDIPAVARAAGGSLAPGGLVITIAAGVRIASVAQALPEGSPVVRAMPNTPALVRRGATALAAGPHAGPEHLAAAREIFGAVGTVCEVKEELLDAVTAMASSGVAYVMLFIESLADAGVAQGLDRATALELAMQTVAGSAELLAGSGEHPALLRDKVTSPGGTTAAGLSVLDRAGFKGIIEEAVARATARGKELGKG